MSDQPASPIVVSHNLAEHRFEAQVDGHLAVVEYERDGTRLIMTHTFVPPELRGRGIAEKLVRPALDYARNERLTVVPACSYVAVFIQRHPEYQALVQ
ncbi:MAG: N-acetyltransferase [Verrucomicrobia bacterium]|nr:N-acetyltransferase [Verrucomicrobiota bacterium]